MADDHAPARKPSREELLARIAAPTDPKAYRAEVQKGLDDIAAGRVIPAEDMRLWVESLSTANPLPRPRCR